MIGNASSSPLATVLLAVALTLPPSLANWQYEAKLRDFPFRNTSLPWSERVDDLVSRLTLEEIQLQMAKGGAGEKAGPAPAIPRLGIGPYQWDTECLNGDAQASGAATGFPAPIGMSASFSHQLLFDAAEATGKEVRGKHNTYVKEGNFGWHTGASCFSPVINIARDPRWGRIVETYGEDPYLSGQLATHFVHGLQGNHPRFVRATSTCKHFDVHGGPENIPVSRFSFNANVTMADWRMTFLPAFKQCVDAGTYSIMCSYNRINGVPACANKELLTTLLRDDLGFKGYVISDQAAVENIITEHKWLKTKVDTAAACVNAGCNLELSSNLEDSVYMHIVEAVQQGKLTKERVHQMVKPLFYTRMRLGEFDPPSTNPYASLGEEQVESPEHQALAIRAAQMSYVLLKNEKKLLPLRSGEYKNVALIGPMSDNYDQLFTSYPANQPRHYTKTPLEAFRQAFPGIKNGTACRDLTPCTKYNAEAVPVTVNDADLIFVALGTGKQIEQESRDRPDTNLPGQQKALLLDVIKNSKPTAKIVVLLFNAGPLNITFADENSRVGAILECWIPGQGTGDALVNVLFNKNGNSSPAARLTMTWPRYASQIPSMVNYSMFERTYRYSDSESLYPFGYGLSYSTIMYDELKISSPSHDSTKPLRGSLTLVNTGDVDADEVTQCYIGPVKRQPYPAPITSLGYFRRTHLKAGSLTTLEFELPPEVWAVWKNGGWTFPKLPMILTCGGGQRGQRGAETVSIEVAFF